MKALIFYILILALTADPPPIEYFGDSYRESEAFLKKNEKYIKNYFEQKSLDYKMAMAIVFPEIIRYNRFRDFIETTLLEKGYVLQGSSVVDFSIGYFQMKPSFVESIEKEVISNQHLHEKYPEIAFYKSSSSETSIRKERISRLKRFEWQLKYLACFIDICLLRFENELKQNPDEKLRVLSSAYNYRFNAGYDELIKISQEKSFPYGVYFSRFSYYDVAAFFHQSITCKN